MPQLPDLANDLVLLGIASRPFDGRMESVHDAVNLESGGGIDMGPYSADVISPASFEQRDVETMSNNVSSGRDASQASSDDCNLRSSQSGTGWRRTWGEDLVQQPLQKGIHPEDWRKGHVADVESG